MKFKKALPALQIGIIAITLLDVIGSLASRRFDFPYSYLAILSFSIYILTGFLAAKWANRLTGVICAGMVGLYDATMGFEISILLGANMGGRPLALTPMKWLIMAIIVMLIAGIIGMIGAWLAGKLIKSKVDGGDN